MVQKEEEELHMVLTAFLLTFSVERKSVEIHSRTANTWLLDLKIVSYFAVFGPMQTV